MFVVLISFFVYYNTVRVFFILFFIPFLSHSFYSEEVDFFKDDDLLKNFDSNVSQYSKSGFDDFYPFSSDALKSCYYYSYISYIDKDYIKSAYTSDECINVLMDCNNGILDRVLFLNGLSYYKLGSKNILCDSDNYIKSINSFKKIVSDFSSSDFYFESLKKINEIESKLAKKEMKIASFYFNKKNYASCVTRYDFILNNYKSYIFSKSEIDLIKKSYYILGYNDDNLVKTLNKYG